MEHKVCGPSLLKPYNVLCVHGLQLEQPAAANKPPKSALSFTELSRETNQLSLTKSTATVSDGRWHNNLNELPSDVTRSASIADEEIQQPRETRLVVDIP